MIPPLVIFSRSGVDVVCNESSYTPEMKARARERRRRSPFWWAGNGAMAGICMGYLANLGAADLEQWTQPSSLMALGSFIFAAGQLWSARMDDRRRITKLEENAATKESVSALAESLQHMDAKLDRLIERR